MTYTTHGHHIPGTIKGTDRPKRVDRCGGVAHCKQCIDEAEKTPPDIPATSQHFEEQVDWDIDANKPAQSFPAEIIEAETELEKDLGHILNKHSAENESGTPDFILAMYLKAQLDLFNQTIKNRASWRGESVELPALQRLHQDTETMDRVIKYLRQLVEDGVIVVNEDLEATDVYRGIMDMEGVASGNTEEVPFVMYENGRRNELGTATVKITPGEVSIEGKTLAAVEAIFLESEEAPSKGPAADPDSRFSRYQRGGLTDNGK